MTTSTIKQSFSKSPRSAFTLVELLVVILIIGILAAIILPAIGGAFGAANELKIRTEMVQVEGGIESFKTKYGFYPPSFQQFDGANEAAQIAQFLPFLNRISPNHQENSSSPSVAGRSRLQVWWNRVGRFLNQETSMVFWLSGLCKSKQFPLTGGADFPVPAYNTDAYSDGSPFTLNGLTMLPDGSPFVVERDVISDFNNNQLVFYTILGTELRSTSAPMTGGLSTQFLSMSDLLGSSEAAVVAAYLQPAGRGETTYKYRDAASYAFAPYAYMQTTPGINGDTRTLGDAAAVGQNDFVNPKTFQLVSFGMDGDPGVPFATLDTEIKRQLAASVFPVSGDVLAQVKAINAGWQASDANRAADNQTNFAAGRLDLYWIANE